MTTSKTALPCPHCNGPMQTRSSRSLSAYYRQAYMACIDPECGATYGVSHEITHQISPSGKPDPTVMIRRSPPRKPRADAGIAVLPNGEAAALLTLPGDTSNCGPEVPLAPANDDGRGVVWIGIDLAASANDDDDVIDTAANS